VKKIANYETYIVKKGDTLWGISKKFNVTIDEIKKLNNLNSNTIYANQKLKIKDKTTEVEIEKTPILGKNNASLQQMINFVKDINANFNPMIATKFFEIGEQYGIRGDVAFCQSIHETDWFRFGGDVRSDQNNYAGLGATGGVPGHSFSSVEEGVNAQIQHLFAYATDEPLPEGEKIVDPRFDLVKRGSAPTWEDLAGKWAYPGYNRIQYESLNEALIAGETYGQIIVKLYKRMIKTRKFKPYTIDAFEAFLEGLPSVSRNINHIQIHHTWKPRKTDYTGERTIYGMWRYHTKTRGWDDIGQHYSIAPDGLIWDGRSLQSNPAGIKGHNSGGLMFEIIGNFDKGEEKLEGKQLQAVVHAVRACMKAFNLNSSHIVFHREHASKTCPGTGITKAWFLKQLGISEKEPTPKEEGKLPVVVLDPAHGGKDTGPTGNGLVAKEVTLQLGKVIRDWLTNCYAVEVKLTREEDSYVTPVTRAKYANELNADYFVSLQLGNHEEGFESCIYPGTIAGATGKMQNAVHEAVMSFLQAYDVKDRGKKEADLTVLRRTKMPALLLKLLSINHKEESDMLNKEEILEGLAKAIANGIAKALGLVALYPQNTPDWKKEAIGWMYSKGLISDQMWKQKVEEPLPLWAEAVILKRVYDKLEKKEN
jgi:N-acetylmuramoyl-L-alanine amidase